MVPSGVTECDGIAVYFAYAQPGTVAGMIVYAGLSGGPLGTTIAMMFSCHSDGEPKSFTFPRDSSWYCKFNSAIV